MKRDKYKLTDEQQKLFDEYRDAVRFTIFKQFYSLVKMGYMEEIETIGYLGLVYAVKTYDESKGANMLTWAINNIRFAIFRYIKQLEHQKKISASQISTQCIEESERTGEPCGRCKKLFAIDHIGQYVDEVDKWQVVDLLNKTAQETFSERVYSIYKKIYIEGKSFSKVANEMGLCRNRIYQIDRKIIQTLKKVCEENGVI